MSGRAAFAEALYVDPYLNSLGMNDDSIFHNYSSEERPRNDGPFIIMRYGAQNRPVFRDVKSPEPVTVWVHWPIELTNDYEKLIKILDRIDDVANEISDQTAHEGYTLAFVEIGGRSADLIDDGFKTITKNADYQLHSQKG
jgi:hypothetical protein